METEPVYTVPPCPNLPSSCRSAPAGPHAHHSGRTVAVQEILLAGVLTVLCPVLVSPQREAYRRAVVILVLLIILVTLTRVPMELPQLPELRDLQLPIMPSSLT
jgi:hypothetical protein